MNFFEGPLWIAFDRFIDLVFVGDMMVTSMTAVILSKGQVKIRLKEIWFNYLKIWFFLDFIATFPWEVLLSSDFSFFQMMKLTRLFRVGRIYKYLDKLPFAKYIRVLRLLLIFLFASHCVGCFLFYFENQDLLENQSKWEVYVSYLYFGVMIIAGNDVKPSNLNVMTYVTVCYFWGTLLHTIVFSGVATIIFSMDEEQGEIRRNMDIINEEISYNNYPARIEDDIKRFYEFYEFKSKKASKVGKDVNQNLNSGANRQYLILKHFETLTRMKELLSFCSYSLIEQLVTKFESKLELPNTPVTREGNFGNEMYFIASGRCDVFIQGDRVGRMVPGSYFGEIALLMKTKRRTATVVTVEYTELLSIDRESFWSILKDHKTDLGGLLAEAKRRFYGTYDYMSVELKRLLTLYPDDSILYSLWV